MKKMGRGGTAANYLLGKNEAGQVADYYIKDEATGIINDPDSILKVFSIKHGGIVTDTQMRNLCAGLHPNTGKPLLKVHGDKHRAGMDVAPAPPKGFSALWAIGPPELRQLLEAINSKANDRALEHLNNFGTYSRAGHGGKNHIKANFFSFQFQHGSNRDQEPHLHIHNTIMNLTYIPGAGWRTLEVRHAMQWQTSTNAVYFASIINDFKLIGIDIKLIDHHFEIEGVPEELVKFWSSRRNDMLAEAEKEGIDVDDCGGMDRMHIKTRKDKREMTDPHGVWTDQAEKFGFTHNKVKSFFKYVVFQKKEQQNDYREQHFTGKFNGNENDSFNERDLNDDIRRAGIQLKPSSFATRALQSAIKNVKSITDAAQNGMRILSRWDMVSASERDQVFLSSNASSELSKRTRTSDRLRWPDFSVSGSTSSKGLTDYAVLNVVRQAIHEIHETEAVVTENNLHRKITEKMFGECPERIHKVIHDIKSANMHLEELGHVVNLGERDNDTVNKVTFFTTTYFQKIESDLAAIAKLLDDDGKHYLDMSLLEAEFAKMPSLTEEQKESGRHFLMPGSLKIGEGAAGVDKTFSMKPLAAAYKTAGYRVFAIAQADTQKDVLGDALGLAPDFRKNLAQLQSEIAKSKLVLTDKDVLILDEGGLVGSKGMNAFLEVIKASAAKVLITGEERQLSAVNAGPGFNIVMKNVKHVASIENIIRQKEEWQRHMVQDFRRGRAAAGLQKLDEHGELRLHHDRKSQIKALIYDWNSARLKDSKSSLLILAIKNADNRELNLMAREYMKHSNDITGTDIMFECDINHKAGKSVTLPFAVGDKVIIAKKDTQLGITNGTRGYIQGIRIGKNKSYNIDIFTDYGRLVTLNSKEFVDKNSKAFALKHGYAISKWSSLCMTVDQSFVMGGEDDLRYAYVGMSRFKYRLSLYISESKIKQNIREKREPGDKSAISKSEVIKALAARMSFKSEKLSTLDFSVKYKAPVIAKVKQVQQQSFTDKISESIKNINLTSLKNKLTRKDKTTHTTSMKFK